MAIAVGIVGFSGYSGIEAVGLLRHHPEFEPVLLAHRADSGDDAGFLKKSPLRRAPASPESVASEGLKAVILATPAEVSMELAPLFLDAGAAVIDVSGAFRLRTPERHKRWYREEHTSPKLLADAVYGLPEFNREQVRKTRFVANPGCYPTAANLAIRPLVEAGVVDRKAGIVCDAKSGVSGAGRKPTLKTSFCEVTENFSAYSILNHRHVPEVLLTSGLEEAELSFTAQLIPIERGILETIYFRLAKPLSSAEIIEIYQKQYAEEPFVRLYKPGLVPDLHAVAHTNFCDIGVLSDPESGRCVVVSAIDNLGKGAAGQAIQNLNLMFGIDETAGLLLKALIKIGGSLLDDAVSRNDIARQIVQVVESGVTVTVVHGGGKQMTRFLEERGIKSTFVRGLRVTNDETIDAVLKVLAGTVNTQLVASLGGKAVGLTGIDAGLATAEQLDPELGYVGKVVASDPGLIETLTNAGYLPVVACVAGGSHREVYNVNGDSMAVAVASKWKADRLVFLTDVPGVMDASKQIIPTLTVAGCRQLIEAGVATGGMQAKLNAATDAVTSGVGEVRIVKGSEADVVLRVFSGEETGTKVIA